LWAEKLPNGISVLIADTCFKEDVFAQRTYSVSQFFILQFNESFYQKPEGEKFKEATQKSSLNESIVLLTNSVMSSKFLTPHDVRIRTIKIIFEKEHLLQFFDKNTVDILMSNYFSGLLKNKKKEPIDTEYRTLMNELIKEKIVHPLRHHYIQNRIMLLLERFVIKLINSKQSGENTLRLTDDEIVRLMKIEALLVKDFNIAPPGIESLSRLSAMSPTKLKKDFKALYGLPIYEYYQKNRMIHAKSLLLEKKYSIKEVGNKVGYSNLGHFAASFKKEFNMLPRQLSNEDELIDKNEFLTESIA
jgi:AraC-like DNA-binding protein